MHAVRGLILFFSALGICATGAASAQETGKEHANFELSAPIEFRGEWELPFAPFRNPVDMKSWVRVRVEKIDRERGSFSGHFDVYERKLCGDVVNEAFTGSFDGELMQIEWPYQICPGMKPLQLTLWKSADGVFRGRVNGRYVQIHDVITGNDR